MDKFTKRVLIVFTALFALIIITAVVLMSILPPLYII